MKHLVYLGGNRSHQCIDGNLYCTVEIRDKETGEWIAKQDVGTTNYAEKEKSQASDSFKRACFNWGLDASYILHRLSGYQHQKYRFRERMTSITAMRIFHVASIEYSESREIAGFTITNDKEIVFMNGKLLLRELRIQERRAKRSQLKRKLIRNPSRQIVQKAVPYKETDGRICSRTETDRRCNGGSERTVSYRGSTADVGGTV